MWWGKNALFLITGAGSTGYPYGKEKKNWLLLHTQDGNQFIVLCGSKWESQNNTASKRQLRVSSWLWGQAKFS